MWGLKLVDVSKVKLLGYGIENLCYYEEVTISEYVFLLAVARELDHSGSRLMFKACLLDIFSVLYMCYVMTMPMKSYHSALATCDKGFGNDLR